MSKNHMSLELNNIEKTREKLMKEYYRLCERHRKIEQKLFESINKRIEKEFKKL